MPTKHYLSIISFLIFALILISFSCNEDDSEDECSDSDESSEQCITCTAPSDCTDLNEEWLCIDGCCGPLEPEEDDDDDTGQGSDSGEDIEGTYQVTMTISKDTCDEDNVGYEEDWEIKIEQSQNYGWATVYWKSEGSGTEWTELVQGPVYGSLVKADDVINEQLGSVDCYSNNAYSCQIWVDVAASELTGELSTFIFYEGSECNSSSKDCQNFRFLNPR